MLSTWPASPVAVRISSASSISLAMLTNGAATRPLNIMKASRLPTLTPVGETSAI